ncbi:MAG: MarR family winged helix-turn-helix transcriptional regulator [Intrasporangium sp.]|uniref:MarR family winged helix-turn-helix transcriptional regulator n=1 Tax=Intrasporangium sp. TaxID=1925024 RepID=UPI003F7E615F
MATKRRSAREQHRQAVASYVAAGGEETVQRAITALYAVTKRLDQWYTRQLADATSVAPSSMTHRLDKMAARGLIERRPDPANRTRTLVSLTHDGWELFSHAIRESNVVESDTLRNLDDNERVELARLLEVVLTGLDETGEGTTTHRVAPT